VLVNDEFLRDRARAVRSMADIADSITQTWLLELADRYESVNQGRLLTPRKLPMQDVARVLLDHLVGMWDQMGTSVK
jgi:hypothetical protein